MLRNDIFVIRKKKYKNNFIKSGMDKNMAEKVSDRLAICYCGLQEGFLEKCSMLGLSPKESNTLWEKEVLKNLE